MNKSDKLRSFCVTSLIAAFILSCSNGVPQEATKPAVAPAESIEQGCLQAAIRGINLEIARVQGWIAQRKQGAVPAGDLPGLEGKLKALQDALQQYKAMKPGDYRLPEAKTLEAWVQDAKPGENSILYFDGQSRSGPWYHMTGLAGGDFSALAPKRKYRLTIYPVYPRDYFNMESAYVYVTFAMPAEAGPGEPYHLEFKAGQVDEWGPAGLTSLGGGKVQLVVGLTDGGCIGKETVKIKAVETAAGQTTVVHVIYTLEGQPCKAMFKREMKATLQLPQPGTYRIKLWIHELYDDQGEVLRWEKEITI